MHLYAAGLMGVDKSGVSPEDAGQVLAHVLSEVMRNTGLPNGLSAVGFGPEDVDELVAGTLSQQRLTKLSPRPASAAVLKQLFLDSLACW
jgi:hydroxyacid-oxoacid transhydrogenase